MAFASIDLHGDAGAILWGYERAAALRTWRIFHRSRQYVKDGWAVVPGATWTLSATLADHNATRLKQRPLFFTAPRGAQGFWCWPVVVDSVRWSATTITAVLGQPEQ